MHQVYGYFKDNPHGFEHCAARLAGLMDPNIKIETVTRPSVDGGRDAIGMYRVGPLADRISLDFALEAKCYAVENGVGVKELARLISRLRHRQIGILVTYLFSGPPVVVIACADIAAILVKAGLGTSEAVRKWLVAEFPTDATVAYLCCGFMGKPRRGALRGANRRDQELLLFLVRAVREEKGLHQTDVANALGCPQSFVSKYEAGARRLDLLELKNVCDAIGVEPTEVVRRFEAALEAALEEQAPYPAAAEVARRRSWIYSTHARSRGHGLADVNTKLGPSWVPSGCWPSGCRRWPGESLIGSVDYPLRDSRKMPDVGWGEY